MDNSTSIGLSSQMVLQQQMDVLANNIANQSTPGFKGEQMMFSEYLSGGSSDRSSYVREAGTTRDMSEGPLTNTGNPLDIALKGNGFLTVTTPTGTAYTRGGHFQLDSQGELVTSNGYLVQGDGGSPIVLPQGTSGLTIATDGTISTPKGQVGKLPVVDFDNPQSLDNAGAGLYTTTQPPNPIKTAQVEQGTIEGSNVQPVLEMTRLLAASRSISSAKNFTDGESTRQKNAIDRLGKTV